MSTDLHSFASALNGIDPSVNTQIVATAIENDQGTGAHVPSPNTTSTDAFTQEENTILQSLNLGGSETNQGSDNTLAIEQQLAQSAASGGQNQQLGPQLGLEDVSSTTTTGATSSGSSGILIIGVLIVAGTAGYIWWKHKHKEA